MKQLLLYSLCLFSAVVRAEITQVDICIYGGTSAGVIAALQAAKEGKSVALVEAGQHLGGMSVEGLGGTDIDNHRGFQNSPAVGGLAREFYRRVSMEYHRESAFDKMVSTGEQNPSLWRFEPHVAEAVFGNWVKATPGIRVLLGHRLKEQGGVTKVGPRITALQFENGGLLQYAALPNWQRLRAPFRPVPGVTVAPGSYDYLRHAITLQTDPSERLAFRFEGQIGGYFDGDLQTWRGVLQATPDPRLALSADYTINRLDRVGGLRSSLTTHLLGVETRLATTPRLQLVSFVQWNTVARQLTANARLAWEYRPLSFFTIVYNDRSPVDGRGVVTTAPFTSRQLLIKLTWLTQV